MSHFFVERFMPGGVESALPEQAAQFGGSVDDGARLLMTIYSPSDETCFHLFAADSAAEIQEMGRAAGVVLDRVVQVRVESKGVPSAYVELQ
jgi:hypothetical protein